MSYLKQRVPTEAWAEALSGSPLGNGTNIAADGKACAEQDCE